MKHTTDFSTSERKELIMTFKVKYTLTSHSRHGNYVYGFCDKVEAESKDEAVQSVKSKSKENHGHWKFRLIAITEV